MNVLAQELNARLSGTVLERSFSQFGQRIFFPKGIVAQAQEAAAKAPQFNATAGVSRIKGTPTPLPSIARFFNDLSSSEEVGYAPTSGVPDLRKQWKQHILEVNPQLEAKDFSTPTVVPGLTHGIFQSFQLFLEREGEVVLPDAYWENYQLMIEQNFLGSIRSYPLFTTDGVFNVSGFKKSMRDSAKSNPKNKAVTILNFPNNPTGYTPSVSEAQHLADACVELAEEGIQLVVIADDAYFGLYYEEGLFEHSIFSLLAQAHENILAVKVDGTTKEDFSWGFRIGFVSIGSKGLTDDHYDAFTQKLVGSLRLAVSNSSMPAQSIMKKAMVLDTYKSEKAGFRADLKTRYDVVIKTLESLGTHPGAKKLKALPFNSGYFMTFTCMGFPAEQLRSALLEKGVGTIALQESLLRVTFASIDKELLPELYTSIYETAAQMK